MYVLGDLNDNMLVPGNRLNRIIHVNRLHQIIDLPTRVTPQSATLLDVLITNKQETILHKDVIPNIIGDHDLITASINITKPKRLPVIKTFRHLGAYSRDALCNALLSRSNTLNQLLNTDDVDIQVSIFTSAFSAYLDSCAPSSLKK